ncbi:MAG: T9SS type A sorting domain-containing protein [Flavobacteriales bacterium]|nr:T9SS type A sorting domain-containing protein [Flavobacteriales bacterium]
MTRKLYSPFVLMLVGLSASFAQVNNQTSVYLRPGTNVHVLGAFNNSTAGSVFTMDNQSLLYVGGDMNNNGTFTMENDASLLRGDVTADAGSGTFYVKRQGTSSLAYNYWGTPVAASGSVPGNPSYRYDEALSTQDPNDDNNPNPDPGWFAYNGNMTPGDGYAGWSANLATFTDNEVNNGNVNAPMNISVFNPTPAPGVPGTPFNLVGNPYPSGLNCSQLVLDNTGIHGSLYFWVDDATQGSGYSAADYAIWNFFGTIPNTANANGSPVPNGIIKTGQGFLVRNGNTGPSQLQFRNGQRVANTASNAFFRANAEESKLWLSLNGTGVEFFSQILVGATEDATSGEDLLYDAIRLPANTGVSLSATQGQSNYGILAFPPPALEEVIPLNVFVGENGTFTFRADEMIGFQDLDVYLNDIDPIHGSSTLLGEGTEVNINLTSGHYENRFYLNFTPNLTVGVDENEDIRIRTWAFGDQLTVQLSQNLEGNSTLELLDMSGRLVLSESKLNFSNNKASVSVKGISVGNYIVRVVNKDQVLSQKVFMR